jgi:hypothetical protein
MARHKNDLTAGMEAFLNNPNASYGNPHIFKEIHKQSGMSISEMLKQVGRQSKQQKVKQPTDKELSEQRLKVLETKTNS